MDSAVVFLSLAASLDLALHHLEHVRVDDGSVVSCTTEFTGQAVGVAEPELVFRADALAVGLVALSVSVMETGVLFVDLFGYFHLFTGGFEIDAVRFSMVVFLLHK